jgi:hypothetical protein
MGRNRRMVAKRRSSTDRKAGRRRKNCTNKKTRTWREEAWQEGLQSFVSPSYN